ncbi:hypothetical protein LBMAG53_24850 [Planctomycetota bacterium]|nr:hypothetical protein LBMAG53_24850 [Planctomycetota bacterium]
MLNRRHFLRAAGVTLALPWLEAFDPPAASTSIAGPPARSVFFMVPSGVNMWRWHPKEFGAGYAMSESLTPLESYRSELTIFSGLEHANGSGGGHYEVGVFLTGNPKYKSKDGPVEPNTISIDQHIAGSIGTRTRIPSLVLSPPGGSVTTSFDAKGAYINAENDLRRLFNELCGSTDVLARLDRRASVLDLVGAQAKSLSGQLGRHDRSRFDDYLHSVREVEGRLQGDRNYFASRPLSAPDAELALDADPIQRRADYIRTQLDLVALALRNDQTRIVSILACGSGSEFYGNWPEFGGGTHHGASHGTNTEDETAQPKNYAFLAKHDQWWIGHLDRFLGKLQDTKEGDSTLLASTMVLYGSGMSWTHCPANLPILLAGGSRLGLKHGNHLRFNRHKDAKGSPVKDVKKDQTTLCDLHRTISERMGVPAAGFGDSTKVIAELV